MKKKEILSITINKEVLKKFKQKCHEHGDISRNIEALIKQHLGFIKCKKCGAEFYPENGIKTCPHCKEVL